MFIRQSLIEVQIILKSAFKTEILIHCRTFVGLKLSFITFYLQFKTVISESGTLEPSELLAQQNFSRIELG